MKYRILLVLATGFVCWSTSVAIDPQIAGLANRPPKDTHDFIYFGETRPILFRLKIEVDGKPLQAVWDEFVKSVFTALDTNKDGVLSKTTQGEALPKILNLRTQGSELFKADPESQAKGSRQFAQSADFPGRIVNVLNSRDTRLLGANCRCELFLAQSSRLSQVLDLGRNIPI